MLAAGVRGTFAVDEEAPVDEEVEAAEDVAPERGVNGRGHTISRTPSGQYCAI